MQQPVSYTKLPYRDFPSLLEATKAANELVERHEKKETGWERKPLDAHLYSVLYAGDEQANYALSYKVNGGVTPDILRASKTLLESLYRALPGDNLPVSFTENPHGGYLTIGTAPQGVPKLVSDDTAMWFRWGFMPASALPSFGNTEWAEAFRAGKRSTAWLNLQSQAAGRVVTGGTLLDIGVRVLFHFLGKQGATVMFVGDEPNAKPYEGSLIRTPDFASFDWAHSWDQLAPVLAEYGLLRMNDDPRGLEQLFKSQKHKSRF